MALHLYPMFTRITREVSVDPHSGFWYYHQEIDPFGDPLELLISCEEGDEEALALLHSSRSPKEL